MIRAAHFRYILLASLICAAVASVFAEEVFDYLLGNQGEAEATIPQPREGQSDSSVSD